MPPSRISSRLALGGLGPPNASALAEKLEIDVLLLKLPALLISERTGRSCHMHVIRGECRGRGWAWASSQAAPQPRNLRAEAEKGSVLLHLLPRESKPVHLANESGSKGVRSESGH